MRDFLKNIKKYLNYSIYSSKSELKSEISKSYLSWLWWIINPLMFMLIYMFVAGVVFNKSEPNFPIFVFLGLIIWNFFNNMLISCTKIIENNKSLITKIYLPKYILILSKSFTLLFKFLINFILIIIFLFIFKVNITIKILFVIPIFIIFYLLIFGLSCIVTHLGVIIEDLQNVLILFLRILFYISGIFYNINLRVASPYKFYLTRLNPVAFFITEFRKILLYNKMPSFNGLLFWTFTSIIILIVGVKLIKANENNYAKVI